jgi:hypothetical protein
MFSAMSCHGAPEMSSGIIGSFDGLDSLEADGAQRICAPTIGRFGRALQGAR